MYSEGEIRRSDIGPRDLQLLVERGESHVLEFKKTIPSAGKIAREISALSNTVGGIILVGVTDDGLIVGIRDFFEEEHWIREAAERLCEPRVDLVIEIVHFQDRDVMVVRVPESSTKPVYVGRERGRERTAYVRDHEQSVVATPDRIGLLTAETEETPVTFEYGEKEQRLFRFLHEYGEITAQRYADLGDIAPEMASKTLIHLVKAGILSMFKRDQTEVYCFSKTE
jgi:predicted HTH transcriptional regulator